ncbi:MAG: Ku protein [Parachlamydiales bacterium]|jgi:DNA end-binding protein Ku
MHTVWKGSLSFGLVNIPVRMYTASRERELKFVLLHKKDLSQIRYARICKNEEKEVPWDEIVKGYEYQKGDFVILDDKDFEKVDVKKSKSIEIVNFIDEEEIDPIYFVKPYFLEPDKEAGNAYSLLRDAMKKSKKVALARYVIRNHEHLAAVKVHDNMLLLIEMRYCDELVQPEDLKIPTVKSENKQLEMAIKFIEQLTVPFVPEDYKDTYTEELKEVIEKKAKGKTIQPKSGEPKKTKVHDIMALLQASLEGTKKKPAPKSGKKSA